MRFAGREEIVGMARNAAARSDAFLSEGEARLMLSIVPTAINNAQQRGHAATEAIAHLADVVARRTGVAEWYLACGDGPDELSTLAALGAQRGALEAALAAADAEQAAQLLMELANGNSPASARARLALCCSTTQLATLLAALASRGGPALSLWCCDRALQVRFSLRRSGAAFRCDHPLLHSALEQRCRKDSIDLA